MGVRSRVEGNVELVADAPEEDQHSDRRVLSRYSVCRRSGEEAPDAEANEKDDERCVRNPCAGHGGGAIVEGAPCILGKGVAVIGSGFFCLYRPREGSGYW